jgi:hypothetical protein
MTHEFMKLYGTKLAHNGFAIVPIAAGQKFPGEYSSGRWWPMKNWQLNAHSPPHELLIENVWSNYPGCGIGICCGGATKVIGFDIDVMDAEISAAIRRNITEILGETPLVRIGKAPTVMMLYRTTEPMDKITMSFIEVLGNGNQLAHTSG